MTDYPATRTRRTVLQTIGATTAIGLAGCRGGEDRPDDVVLDPPPNYDTLRETDRPYPIYGELVPEAAVPDVLSGEAVSTRQFVGERALLLTFVYTRGEGICLDLGSVLVQVQASAAEAGASDGIAVAAMSFDPTHDTPERLRNWGRERGLEYDLGNAHLLRPRSPQRARTVVTDRFGETYEAGDAEGTPFTHDGLLLLVNDGAVVERAYVGEAPRPATVVDDVETLLGV